MKSVFNMFFKVKCECFNLNPLNEKNLHFGYCYQCSGSLIG